MQGQTGAFLINLVYRTTCRSRRLRYTLWKTSFGADAANSLILNQFRRRKNTS